MELVIIGGGHAGRIVGEKCLKAGLQVAIVEIAGPAPEDWPGEWIQGKGIVSNRELVAILDPVTGDERRLLPTKAIVIAVGKLDPENLPQMMLGSTKLGALFSDSRSEILCNDKGETNAEGIYVTGSCASGPTPYLVETIVTYCTKSLAER